MTTIYLVMKQPLTDADYIRLAKALHDTDVQPSDVEYARWVRENLPGELAERFFPDLSVPAWCVYEHLWSATEITNRLVPLDWFPDGWDSRTDGDWEKVVDIAHEWAFTNDDILWLLSITDYAYAKGE